MHEVLFFTHLIAVRTFVIINLVKGILFLANRKQLLGWLLKYIKIPERLVAVILLGTGIYLIVNLPAVNQFMIIKLTCVAAAIPLVIIAYLKKIKILALLSFALLLGAYGLAEASKKQSAKGKIAEVKTANGQQVFNAACSQCHGIDAKQPISNVPDLHSTRLSGADLIKTITNGRGSMPAYKTILTGAQLNAVAAYIQSLKK